MSNSSRKFQIVLAAFGTSTDSSVIYASLKERFEERFKQRVLMGFTSRMGNPKLKTVLGELSSKREAEVVITPLFMIPGKVVLDDIKKVTREFERHLKTIRISKPLLPDDRIYQVLRQEFASDVEKSRSERRCILFVGHGTPDRDSSFIYSDCAQKIKSLFPPSLKVAFGNVELSAPYCKDVLGELIMSDIRTLVVQPFMIVDGVHIHDDIRGALDGNHDDNKLYRHLLATYGEPLKKRLREIEFIYKPGLGAYQGIFEIFADHTMQALSVGGSL